MRLLKPSNGFGGQKQILEGQAVGVLQSLAPLDDPSLRAPKSDSGLLPCQTRPQQIEHAHIQHICTGAGRLQCRGEGRVNPVNCCNKTMPCLQTMPSIAVVRKKHILKACHVFRQPKQQAPAPVPCLLPALIYIKAKTRNKDQAYCAVKVRNAV